MIFISCKIAYLNQLPVYLLVLKNFLKYIYSEKATKFCKISTLLLTYVVQVKSKVEILQKFLASSEYMNFKTFWIAFT